ncbi:MAG: HAMP domain-containing protein [Clostridia bacterium]|nr:HAMP domain-containing protein [Clostridia bacterium]
MFKSVFAKYVTVFMTIITFGFVLLLLIVTSIVSHYSGQAKNELMDQVAQVMQGALSDDVQNSAASLEEQLKGSAGDELDRLFNTFSMSGKDNLSLWVSDSQGKVLYAKVLGDEDTPYHEEQAFPAELIQSIQTQQEYSDTVAFDEANHKALIRALGVYDETGALCAIVAVGSTNIHWGIMVEEITQTVITAALLVILASLIAAYFITERTVQPLREMNDVVHDFADGDFEKRVVVRGKDEVGELAEAFNQMAESLENLEKMRSSFIANVSHDLRTPMTTIAGFIDGIREGVIPPEEQDHYLEVVSLEVHRLSRLVASLLDLSRIQAGDRKFVMKSFDICEMARVILISLEQKIEEKQLDISFVCDEERIFVQADHDAIYQVFYNICHNAVKFSNQGGKLSVCIEEIREKKVQVSVYNEGAGIPKDDIPFIFDRFYKSDKSRGLDKSGIGLGLYISKTIIAAHGEKIWVKSESGKNCEFTFTLSRSHTAGAPSSKSE